MTFRQTSALPVLRRAVIAFACLMGVMGSAQAGQATAVVPQRTIYPGEELLANLVREVVVTNPNLRAGYAEITDDVLGKIHHPHSAARTNHSGWCASAMPGRWSAANRFRLVFAGGGLTITAVGTPLAEWLDRRFHSGPQHRIRCGDLRNRHG